jgi:hypothetical protein
MMHAAVPNISKCGHLCTAHAAPHSSDPSTSADQAKPTLHMAAARNAEL